MVYRVIVQPAAEAEARAVRDRIAEVYPIRADRWYRGLMEKIQRLERFPERCPLAPESEVFDRETRETYFGKRGKVYRILFQIAEETVQVLHIRHGAQQFLGE